MPTLREVQLWSRYVKLKYVSVHPGQYLVIDWCKCIPKSIATQIVSHNLQRTILAKMIIRYVLSRTHKITAKLPRVVWPCLFKKSARKLVDFVNLASKIATKYAPSQIHVTEVRILFCFSNFWVLYSCESFVLYYI